MNNFIAQLVARFVSRQLLDVILQANGTTWEQMVKSGVAALQQRRADAIRRAQDAQTKIEKENDALAKKIAAAHSVHDPLIAQAAAKLENANSDMNDAENRLSQIGAPMVETTEPVA